MEYYFWVAILFIIFVRSKLFKTPATWIKKVGYVFSLLIATAMFDISFHAGYLNAVDDAATFGIILKDYKLALLPMLGKLYTNGNPLFLFIILLLICELFAYLLSKLSSLKSTESVEAIDELTSLWWANVIIFLAAPAFVFAIVDFDASSERGLDVVSFNLNPLLQLYCAPARWLGIYLLSDSDMLSANTGYSRPQYPITMRVFTRDIIPWFVLCIVLTLFQWLIPYSRCKNCSLKEYIFGCQSTRIALKVSNLWRLPWRGICLSIYLLVAIFLVGLALLLKLLMYGIIAFFYGGFLLIIPMLIIWVIYLIFGKR